MAKQKDDIKVLTERIRSGDRVSLSQSLTLSESHLQEHQNKPYNCSIYSMPIQETPFELVLVVFQVQENLLLLRH